MLPARIEGSTRTLGKPANWDDQQNGKCAGLAIRDEMHGGLPYMVSAYTPTPEEIEALKAGASIHLYINGVVHPPVMLTVGKVPADLETQG